MFHVKQFEFVEGLIRFVVVEGITDRVGLKSQETAYPEIKGFS